MHSWFRNFLLFLIWQLSICLATFAMEDNWDPSLYRESSHMQKRWAKSVMEGIDFDSARTILDIGSGDGDITRDMAQQCPKALVFGLDISHNMVTFANKSHNEHPNLFFINGDAQKLPFKEQFDLITSFNTMHRLPEPTESLNGIYSALKPGGKFIAAFPVSGSRIMSQAIATVDTLPKWKDYFSSPDRKAYSLTDKEYKEWLTKAGFIVLKARTKWEDEIFESKEKFRDLLRATFSHRAKLPPEREIEFFEELVNEYLDKSPLDQNGRVHFYFNRIEIIAVKPVINQIKQTKLKFTNSKL